MKKLAAVLVLVAVALWYLRDPAWLASTTSGLRGWEQSDGRRYRWSGGHASLFIPSSAISVNLPLSTTFAPGDGPMIVTVSIDDVFAARVLLTDASWRAVTLTPAARTTRRLRRVDVRTSVTRDDNHGVRIGEPVLR